MKLKTKEVQDLQLKIKELTTQNISVKFIASSRAYIIEERFQQNDQQRRKRRLKVEGNDNSIRERSK